MTEKRFEIDNEMTLGNKVETYELCCIRDNDTGLFYFIVDMTLNVESFVERLNNLNDENDQLKRRNKKLEKHLRRFYSDEEWKLKELLGDFE